MVYAMRRTTIYFDAVNLSKHSNFSTKITTIPTMLIMRALKLHQSLKLSNCPIRVYVICNWFSTEGTVGSLWYKAHIVSVFTTSRVISALIANMYFILQCCIIAPHRLCGSLCHRALYLMTPYMHASDGETHNILMAAATFNLIVRAAKSNFTFWPLLDVCTSMLGTPM